MLLSPAINIQVEKMVSRAVKLSLPLLFAPISNAGFLKILRREDSPKANWKVEELKLALKHEQNTVEFETIGFSWYVPGCSSRMHLITYLKVYLVMYNMIKFFSILAKYAIDRRMKHSIICEVI